MADAIALFNSDNTERLFATYLKIFQSLTTIFVTMLQQDTGYSFYSILVVTSMQLLP